MVEWRVMEVGMEWALVAVVAMPLVGVAVFLMVVDTAHWRRRGPRGFEVEAGRGREKE